MTGFLTPFFVVVFMVSISVGYIYLERRDLVAGRLEGLRLTLNLFIFNDKRNFY